jgi:hypothetical protein
MCSVCSTSTLKVNQRASTEFLKEEAPKDMKTIDKAPEILEFPPLPLLAHPSVSYFLWRYCHE